MKSALLLTSILAATSAAAQIDGDWRMAGRAGMMGGTYGGSILFSVLSAILWIGLILLVWLWAFKLWKEIRRMK